jgi:hypothetical protein
MKAQMQLCGAGAIEPTLETEAIRNEDILAITSSSLHSD